MVSNWCSLLASCAGYCISHPSRFFNKISDRSNSEGRRGGFTVVLALKVKFFIPEMSWWQEHEGASHVMLTIQKQRADRK